MTPENLAARLDCEPALILDYESGRARIGATALIMLADVLQVEIGYFLAGLNRGGQGPGGDRAPLNKLIH